VQDLNYCRKFATDQHDTCNKLLTEAFAKD
jgi:hypothetical protein